MITFFIAGLALLALLGGAYLFWARRIDAEIREGAEVEWARLVAGEPDLVAGFDLERFAAVYRRVHFPRFPAYGLAALALFLASLPVTLGALAAGAYAAERLGLTPNSVGLAERYLVEDGRMRIVTAAPPEAAAYWIGDLGGFYYFFGVVLAWMLVVALAMRRYHARRPGHLRDELIRARG
jgi:hypothetical protein